MSCLISGRCARAITSLVLLLALAACGGDSGPSGAQPVITAPAGTGLPLPTMTREPGAPGGPADGPVASPTAPLVAVPTVAPAATPAP